jgi:hypothetical protein
VSVSSSTPAGLEVTTTTTASAADGTVLALDLLATVVVENEHPNGYVRTLFEHWVDLDGNGCDTRAEVLARDSSTPVQRDSFRCHVIAGDWLSPYDGLVTDDPATIDIDHVVPLKEAWESGAWEWTPTARKLYANDLTDDRTLRAVSATSNRAKGDQDPAEWLPPLSAYRCRYLADWVAIKARWGLSVDSKEKSAIAAFTACRATPVQVVVFH